MPEYSIPIDKYMAYLAKPIGGNELRDEFLTWLDKLITDLKQGQRIQEAFPAFANTTEARTAVEELSKPVRDLQNPNKKDLARITQDATKILASGPIDPHHRLVEFIMINQMLANKVFRYQELRQNLIPIFELIRKSYERSKVEGFAGMDMDKLFKFSSAKDYVEGVETGTLAAEIQQNIVDNGFEQEFRRASVNYDGGSLEYTEAMAALCDYAALHHDEYIALVEKYIKPLSLRHEIQHAELDEALFQASRDEIVMNEPSGITEEIADAHPGLETLGDGESFEFNVTFMANKLLEDYPNSDDLKDLFIEKICQEPRITTAHAKFYLNELAAEIFETNHCPDLNTFMTLAFTSLDDSDYADPAVAQKDRDVTKKILVKLAQSELTGVREFIRQRLELEAQPPDASAYAAEILEAI